MSSKSRRMTWLQGCNGSTASHEIVVLSEKLANAVYNSSPSERNCKYNCTCQQSKISHKRQFCHPYTSAIIPAAQALFLTLLLLDLFFCSPASRLAVTSSSQVTLGLLSLELLWDIGGWDYSGLGIPSWLDLLFLIGFWLA